LRAETTGHTVSVGGFTYVGFQVTDNPEGATTMWDDDPDREETFEYILGAT